MLPDASNIKAISMTAGYSGKEKTLILDSDKCFTWKLYFVLYHMGEELRDNQF